MIIIAIVVTFYAGYKFGSWEVEANNDLKNHLRK